MLFIGFFSYTLLCSHLVIALGSAIFIFNLSQPIFVVVVVVAFFLAVLRSLWDLSSLTRD